VRLVQAAARAEVPLAARTGLNPPGTTSTAHRRALTPRPAAGPGTPLGVSETTASTAAKLYGSSGRFVPDPDSFGNPERQSRP
jgi:hypothetical protein